MLPRIALAAALAAPSCRPRLRADPAADPDGRPDGRPRPADRRARPPQPYQANDGKGFRDVLPPGTRGRYNAAELAAFLSTGATVPHCCDQLGMYRDLMYATPGLTAAQLPELLQGLELRRARRAGRADLLPARGRHDRPRPRLRRAAHLRRARATARCSARATPRPRTGCSSWTSCATRAAGSSPASRAARTPRWTPSSGRSPPTPRPTSSARRRSCPTSSATTASRSSATSTNYIAGINAYIAETQARPVQAARRVRRDRAPRGPAAVEGGRPDRDRVAGRRHLRQGRRRGARLVAGRRRAAEALRQAQGPARVPRLPLRRGPGVADDGARQALPLPAHAEDARARWRGPTAGR